MMSIAFSLRLSVCLYVSVSVCVCLSVSVGPVIAGGSHGSSVPVGREAEGISHSLTNM